MTFPAVQSVQCLEQSFAYKAWANAEILSVLAQCNPDRAPEKYTQAIRLMNHTWVVDQIFYAHLQDRAHAFTADNTVDTPSIDALTQSIHRSDQQLLDLVKAITSEELTHTLCFRFTDGDDGCMSKEQILTHLLLHGAYHRGNVGMLIADLGHSRPKDTFTRFLHRALRTQTPTNIRE
ncbi:DinB family protein [Simiduia agarivorans]|uniref:DinB family protein n=1 Tax=Simiduia agarivorans (strain DSM 21679 / JCM 13881 / BCRC 17597 / SA1) TaxID=1117647 RepID=K4KQ21_SIMAS|nr:DinB family protein [Simiduia agarivorans]AFV00361.1 DinB family protein [Simiduia agarivorans SA1 = DSM 21679]